MEKTLERTGLNKMSLEERAEISFKLMHFSENERVQSFYDIEFADKSISGYFKNEPINEYKTIVEIFDNMAEMYHQKKIDLKQEARSYNPIEKTRRKFEWKRYNSIMTEINEMKDVIIEQEEEYGESSLDEHMKGYLVSFLKKIYNNKHINEEYIIDAASFISGKYVDWEN